MKTRKLKTQPLASRPMQRKSARSRMWQSMRIELVFTAQGIAASATSEVRSTRNYITALVEAGYVRVERVTTYEVGDYTSYALVKNTGPHAPRLRKGDKVVFDPNTNQEVIRVRA